MVGAAAVMSDQLRSSYGVERMTVLDVMSMPRVMLNGWLWRSSNRSRRDAPMVATSVSKLAPFTVTDDVIALGVLGTVVLDDGLTENVVTTYAHYNRGLLNILWDNT